MLKLLLASDEELEAKKEIFHYRITRRGDALALANPVDPLGRVLGSVIILLLPQKSGRGYTFVCSLMRSRLNRFLPMSNYAVHRCKSP